MEIQYVIINFIILLVVLILVGRKTVKRIFGGRLKKINRELNITVIVVSHLPDVQKYLADRVILLEDGEIVDEGSPNEICDKFMEGMEPISL